MATGTAEQVAILRDAPIEIGCCRFRHFGLPKSGKPDFVGAPQDEVEISSHARRWVLRNPSYELDELPLLPSRQLPPLVERREAAHRRRHQERVALVEDALHVGGVHMRVADRDIVLPAGLDHVGHGIEHLRMLLLARKAEFLGKVALANEYEADARHLLENVGEVGNALGVLDHQHDQDFALWIERPYVGLGVVVLLGEPPIAHRGGWTVAADAGGLVERRRFQPRIAAAPPPPRGPGPPPDMWPPNAPKA